MMASSIDPSALREWLDDSAALVLDIRPHAAYTSARIPRAVSLSVPSTLLKRPLFSLDRLSAMLPSLSARNRFSSWPSASRIMVYDADSATAPDSSNLAGLLRKFKADGFTGELAWLRGGFQAVWRDHRSLIDTAPPSPDIEVDDEDEDHSKSNILRTRHLPMAAFSLSSTTIHNSPLFNNNNSSSNPLPPKRLPSIAPPSNPPTAHSHPAFNPFFDTIRQNTELSHGITDRIPLRLPHRVRRRVHDLPFGWLQDIAKRAANAPRQHKSMSDSSSSDSEEDEDGASQADIEEGKEALAMQFFKIELSEQRRLMGVMEHHSKESGQVVEQQQSSTVFPYSITAGVEKGAKNRYRHIWPFEHARVRLHQKKMTDDDYINASYIQPLGTPKRYIATQGPLPATFTDFWTLCWEQNVHVIVMLTREVEGAMVKCGTYWSDSVFGPLRLRLVSTEGLAPEEERPSTAGFFANLSSYSSHPPPKRLPHSAGSQRRQKHQHYHTKPSETVKRVFELTHTAYPEAKPRRIIHLQYLEWPDMNVPEDPRGVLGLIKQVEEAVKETQTPDDQPSDPKKRRRKSPANEMVSVNDIDEKTGIAKHTLGGNNPLLLHCSAGVGRTGGFIVVDAVLDAIRRELRSSGHNNNTREEDAMDVRPDQQPTAPLTMDAHKNKSDENLVVHVPFAAPMQVDSSGSEVSSPFASGKTMQWAENVRDETGIAGTSHGPTSTTMAQNPRNNSPLSFAGTAGSSNTTNTNMLGSSVTRHNNNHGSYYYNSSSSLGTSVSGTSSSYSKANFPSSSSLALAVQTTDLLQAALNNQQEQRLRTMSAPAPSMMQVQVGGVAGSLMGAQQQRGGATGRSSTLPQPTTTMFGGGDMDVDVDGSLVKASRQQPPPMSSDGESPPSRSQSPSADEASSLAHPVPIKHSRPVLGPSDPEQLSPPQERTHSHSQSHSQSHTYLQSHTQPQLQSPAQSKTTFDYKEPRPLHEDFTPPPLTTFDDPIWEVVQDVREQRMSLCQSLRQYVFVHAAIVEGALMVVDEERERAEGVVGLDKGAGMGKESGIGTGTGTGGTPPLKVPETPRSEKGSASGRRKSKSKSQSRSPTKRHGQAVKTHPYSSYDTSSIASSSSLSIGKRHASPTELVKEDKEGDVMLLKRPSVKRKQRSGDDLAVVDGARYHPVPARVSSGMMHAGGVSAPLAGAVAALSSGAGAGAPSMRSMPP